MNVNRDRLDESIDQVASRMVRVAGDDDLASKIISALPERVTWFGWLTHSWAPRLAMIAIAVTAGIMWGTRRPQPIAPAAVIASVPTILAPTGFATAVKELEPNRTKPVESLEPLEPMEPSSVDHERSLPSIAAVGALSIDALVPVSLPEDAPLTLKPLAIDELPLAGETISPR